MASRFSTPRLPVRLRIECLETRETPTVTAVVNYSYDTSGFFNSADRRAAVQRAADRFSNLFQNSLQAIVPTGGNTWSASFLDTITNTNIRIPNPIINADQVVIYVAGGPVGNIELAIASGGSWSATGSDAWLNTVSHRGQPANAIAPWGGFVAFDSNTRWNFSTSAPSSTQYDFTSVALHEFMHIFGFGLGDAPFERDVSNNRFVGPNVEKVFGGPVPLDPGTDHGHWAAGTSSGGQTAIMVPSLPTGTTRTLTPIDLAALQDVGWQLQPSAVPPPPITVPPVTSTSSIAFATGTGAGVLGTITAYDSQHHAIWNMNPFGPDFAGGIRVATADVTGNGHEDVIAVTGPGTTARMLVIDGLTQAILFDANPFDNFDGGMNVAAGDLNGDGIADIAVSPDVGGGPRVRVFSGRSFSQLADFYGIDDSNFRGGARVAIGAISGLKTSDLVVAAGVGGGPRISTFLGASLKPGNTPVQAFGDFFAFEQTLRNGVYVASADIDHDGYADLIVGAGPGGGPRVSVFSGRALKQGTLDRFTDFFAGDTGSRGGVRVATANLTPDGRPDLIIGAGDSQPSTVISYTNPSLQRGASPISLFTVDAYAGSLNGVYVG